MGWIYLAESEGSPSPYVHGSGQLPIVKSRVFLKPFSYLECEKGRCPALLSGMTCEHSEERSFHGWISSMVDSHVRTSVLQELERDWTESEVDWYPRSSGSSGKSDPVLYSSKMCQPLGPVERNEFAKNWPAKGMIAGGMLYRLERSELRTNERGGFSYPTPTARDWKTAGMIYPTVTQDSSTLRNKRYSQGGFPLSYVFKKTFGKRLTASFCEWMMGYHQGHTALDPLAMQWYRSRRGKRLKC